MELPECGGSEFSAILEQCQQLFQTKPDATEVSPVTLFLAQEIQSECHPDAFQPNTKRKSRSSWKRCWSPCMAPAVYVHKKSGELRMCVDYRELNKQTAKDGYPLPLPDEVQDQLARSKIFSTLDFKSRYWQLPVHPEDRFLPWPRTGIVSVLSDAIWAVRSTQFISTPCGQGVVWSVLCHHLRA